MKKLLILLSLSMMVVIACKKEKTSAPTTPSPSAPSNTITEVSLVDFSMTPTVITNPKVIAVLTSPSGTLKDTISVSTITTWTTASTLPANDSIACATYGSTHSATISYPLANDGSYYMLYFYEGTTLMETFRIYTTNIVSGAGPGTLPGTHSATVYFRYAPKLIVLGW